MCKLTVVSLFAGIGGIDLAFEETGFDVVWANEINKYACNTYRNNLKTHIVENDISCINVHQIPRANILTAGFPCQSFSIMGYQRGFNDKRGSLFFEIIRVAKYIKPTVILLENVRNLIYHDKGLTFITIFNTLAELGYYIKYQVLNAKTHGNIPQERKRTFLAAFLDYDIMNAFAFPEETKLNISVDDILNREEEHSEIYYYNNVNKYFELLNKRIYDCTGIYRIDDSGVAMKKYELCPTLKANMGTYPDRVPIIRDNFGIRKLTPYECLALQGFPSCFSFRGIPLNEAYKQVGNTVCVPVVKRIAKKLYDVLT